MSLDCNMKGLKERRTLKEKIDTAIKEAGHTPHEAVRASEEEKSPYNLDKQSRYSVNQTSSVPYTPLKLTGLLGVQHYDREVLSALNGLRETNNKLVDEVGDILEEEYSDLPLKINILLRKIRDNPNKWFPILNEVKKE